ncbi:hypothetical protein HY637_00340 [Candidatus Woesearchaeota archaeon]|nr:hypothetical protein [Candidatus Woesearchaeota archaeon]
MAENNMNIFDIVLLIVGVAAAFLGFQLINQAYKAESGQISWLMIIAIFSWLSLLVMFILLSVMVDVSKKELNELKMMVYMLSNSKKK